jgi:hypothetical protein
MERTQSEHGVAIGKSKNMNSNFQGMHKSHPVINYK